MILISLAIFSLTRFVQDQFSSVQDGTYALRKGMMCSTLSLRNFPSFAFETVPVFAWLMMALSRPCREDRLALPFSMPLSSRWSMVWGTGPVIDKGVGQRDQYMLVAKTQLFSSVPLRSRTTNTTAQLTIRTHKQLKRTLISIIWQCKRCEFSV